MSDLHNAEGYVDYPAYKAQRAADGAKAKAYHLLKTITNVAKLAGFELVGTIRMRDRTGKVHISDDIIAGRELYESIRAAERNDADHH